MKKENLTFPQLVEEMRLAVHNLGGFAKGDAITDIVTISQTFEELKDCSDIEPEYYWMKFIWGVRERGTCLTSSPKVADSWLKSWHNEAIALYKIEYIHGAYSFELDTKFDEIMAYEPSDK